MGVARSITQRFVRGPVPPALVLVGGWLRLDRLYEWSWRSLRRGRVRGLKPAEIREALRIFGDSIPFERVLVIEDSPLAKRIAALSGHVHLPQGKRLAVTVFHMVHFSTELDLENDDMPWLAHELTHVWQYLQRGTRYLTDALKAQSEYGTDAYDIERGLKEGWEWDRFNFEQQGEVVRAYCRALMAGHDVTMFEPYGRVLRGENGAS